MRLGLILAACLAQSAFADPSPEEKLFDPPLTVQKLGAVEGPHPADALTCSYYADLMIRETGTDSFGTGPSYVVYPGPSGARPACRAPATARDTKLGGDGRFLLGRKGAYLVFRVTDGFNSEPFFVRRLPEGQQIYTDHLGGKGLETVDMQGDALHLRYQRGYDAPCSLIKEGAACWSRAMKDGHFVRAIASQPPPIADCIQSYKAQSGTPPDDTSTIIYDVDMTVTPSGKVTVLSRGRVTCFPAG